MEQNLYAIEMEDNTIRIIQATEKELKLIGTKSQYLWFTADNLHTRCDNENTRQLIGKILK